MKKVIFSILALALFSCDSNPKSNDSDIATPASPEKPSYQEQKMTLEESERANPNGFLKVTKVTFRQNLINEWVVEGTVENHASVASYKDVVLDIIYYSKTESELGRKRETLYEFVEPNNYKTFKFKNDGYQEAAQIGIELVSAIPK